MISDIMARITRHLCARILRSRGRSGVMARAMARWWRRDQDRVPIYLPHSDKPMQLPDSDIPIQLIWFGRWTASRYRRRVAHIWRKHRREQSWAERHARETMTQRKRERGICYLLSRAEYRWPRLPGAPFDLAHRLADKWPRLCYAACILFDILVFAALCVFASMGIDPQE